MKLLVDINHPAHVHFFKNVVWLAQERGHEVLITASDKDVACQLLDSYGFEYIRLGNYGTSLIKKIAQIPIMDLKMFNVARNYKPDLLLGLASFRAAHASFLLRKPCYIFDDTEHRTEVMLYLPFAEKVFTPRCFKMNLGRKHVKYNGYHEIAYLHPNYFSPDDSVLDELGMTKTDRFFIVRFVSWTAGHDIGAHGFSAEGKLKMVHELEKYGRVIISSEANLPEELQEHVASVSPHRMHDLLYFASLYVGEGGTMASEAVALGTPSIFVSSLGAGTFEEQEKKYGMLLSAQNEEQALEIAKPLLENPDLKAEWQKKRHAMLKEKIDVTAFVMDQIENAPA